ncbi:MAG: response regulator transcription factor [Saprospiraceae bacterium]|nr:response regulator transcription factor [Saprospiraceae bacterium]
MSEISVLIIEDDPLIASDIQGFLEDMDYSVFAIAHNAKAAFKALEKSKPDIALVDINLGNNMDGFIIAERLYNHYDVPFIYLTSYSSAQVLQQAKETHPMGYIVKPFDEADLFTSIEIAIANYARQHRPKRFTREIINQKLVVDLTPKEFEILVDMYDGKTNRQITEKHFLSLSTIKTHVQRIYDKLDCHTRSETIALIRTLLME